eukprot:1145862-Rhodomonas_salina.2
MCIRDSLQRVQHPPLPPPSLPVLQGPQQVQVQQLQPVCRPPCPPPVCGASALRGTRRDFGEAQQDVANQGVSCEVGGGEVSERGHDHLGRGVAVQARVLGVVGAPGKQRVLHNALQQLQRDHVQSRARRAFPQQLLGHQA